MSEDNYEDELEPSLPSGPRTPMAARFRGYERCGSASSAMRRKKRMREEMDSSASAICSFFDSRVSAMWKASSASAIFAHEPSSARL